MSVFTGTTMASAGPQATLAVPAAALTAAPAQHVMLFDNDLPSQAAQVKLVTPKIAWNVDGCDHDYGSPNQCVPWQIPGSTGAARCAWLESMGFGAAQGRTGRTARIYPRTRRATSARRERDPMTLLTQLTQSDAAPSWPAARRLRRGGPDGRRGERVREQQRRHRQQQRPRPGADQHQQVQGEHHQPRSPSPSGTLTADDGKPYNIRAMTKGVVTLLYFGYTHCPDLCPLTMSNTAVAIRELPKADQSKVRVLFVSVDPGRDTPSRLRSWLGDFDPAFIGLRGTLKQVEAFEQQTGLPLGPVFSDGAGQFQLDHATEMFAYSTDNVAHEAFFPSTPPADMAHDLKLLVAGGVPS